MESKITSRGVTRGVAACSCIVMSPRATRGSMDENSRSFEYLGDAK